MLFILVVSIALHKDAFESLLFAVALAVGLTPEFLPMITSVTLARGAVRMAREQVIVKHLPAIQNFGSIDILCSDKTGTLTTGEMTLDRRRRCSGRPADRAVRARPISTAKFETGIRSPLDAAILKTEPRRRRRLREDRRDPLRLRAPPALGRGRDRKTQRPRLSRSPRARRKAFWPFCNRTRPTGRSRIR